MNFLERFLIFLLSEEKKEETRKRLWVVGCNYHTAYCQDSIEKIATALQTLRRLGDERCLGICLSFDKKDGEVSIWQNEEKGVKRILARIRISGSDGVASKICFVNFTLNDHEVAIFSNIRCSYIPNHKLDFEVTKSGGLC